MGFATLITEGFYREFGLQSNSGVEYYLGEDILTEELEYPAAVSGLPTVGGVMGPAELPIYKIRLKQILKADSPHKVIYEVLAGTTGSGTIAPYGRNSRTVRNTGHIRVPSWTKKSVDFGAIGYQDVFNRNGDIFFPRIELRLIYTTVQNVSQATIDNFNSANMGKRYVLTGTSVNYLFEGAVAILLPNNQFRIEGQWVTNAPMPAVSGGTYEGIDIDLPALGPLDEYTQSNPVGVLQVSRIPLGAFYPF